MKNALLIRLAFLFASTAISLELAAQSISGVINSYHRVTSVNMATNGATLSNAAGLVPGAKVLLIQMKGATMNTDNLPSFGDITAINEAGNYEYNVVCAVAGNDILFKYQLIHPYNITGGVQLITVPQYNIVTVTDTLKAEPWSSSSGTGGVLVFDADTVYQNSPMSVTGQGFAGAPFVNFPTPIYDCSWAVTVNGFFLPLAPVPNQYYSGGPKGEGISAFVVNGEYGKGKQSNGGGGGNNHNTGGAGGGNVGGGGNGGFRSNETFFLCHGTHPGIGGLSVAPYGYTIADNRLFMGGGGGSSHQNNARGTPGGNGGGIILVNANVMVGSGSLITANGLSPVNFANIDPYASEGDGGGGAGAGGSIVLNVNEFIGTFNASATGARGSDASRNVTDCTGPGGGGGGGMVWMKGASISPNVTAAVNGGNNGVISLFTNGPCAGQANGAAPGGGGTSIAGYVPPAMGNFLCAPLSSPELDFFNAKADEQHVSLTWQMNSIANVKMYEVERSFDLVSYSKVIAIKDNGKYLFSTNDHYTLSGTVSYRLKITRNNGAIVYSPLVSISRNTRNILSEIKLFPNPVRDQLTIAAFINESTTIQLSIFNTSGQLLSQQESLQARGLNQLSLSTAKLSPGVYWLMVEVNGMRERKKFIKSY